MDDINRRIQQARKRNHYSQAKLAKLIGLKTTTYSQKEREGKIDCETLKKIAKVLNVTADYLLYGESDIEKKSSKTSESAENITKPQPPPDINVYDLLDAEERYIILTYRNLRPAEKKKAYSLFMGEFGLNVIREKRKEELRNKKNTSENS